MNQMINDFIQQASHDLITKIAAIQEADIQYWIDEGYKRDELCFCFYQRDPYHYSIRYENKILSDRWIHVEFLVNGK